MQRFGIFVLAGCVVLGGTAFIESRKPGNTGGAEIRPPAFAGDELPAQKVPRMARFNADRYGQFWIDGKVNGAPFRFLADTGASGIVFDKRDARRLGIDVKHLVWDGRASTANGIVRTASARIGHLDIGPFSFVDVPVEINEGELGEPLLGMAFLRRLNVSIGNGTMTLSGRS